MDIGARHADGRVATTEVRRERDVFDGDQRVRRAAARPQRRQRPLERFDVGRSQHRGRRAPIESQISVRELRHDR